MTTNLTKSPRSRSSQVVLTLLGKRQRQLDNALGHNHSHGQVLGVRADIAKHHDTWQPDVAPILANEVNDRSHTAGIDKQLGQLRRVLGNLANQSGAVLLHILVIVLQAHERGRKDLSLDDHLGQVDRMLRDLTQSREDLS